MTALLVRRVRPRRITGRFARRGIGPLVAALGAVLAAAGPDLAPPLPPRPAPEARTARVVAVTRVDELHLAFPERTRTVRLDGVIRPPAGPQRTAALAYLRRLLTGERVRFQLTRPADERHPARGLVFREPDGLCVNLELVRLGYAKALLRKDLPGRKAFGYYQRQARRLGKGLWGARPPASRPADAKAAPVAIDAPQPRLPATDPMVYVTRSGRKYHRAGCPHLRKSRIARQLSEVVGRYEPCKRCKPPVPDRTRHAAPASQPGGHKAP